LYERERYALLTRWNKIGGLRYMACFEQIAKAKNRQITLTGEARVAQPVRYVFSFMAGGFFVVKF
jgi:hypothetical protein